MARKVAKRREWTREDVRTLRTMARELKKTTAIARALKRSEGATRQQAFKLSISLGTRKKRKK